MKAERPFGLTREERLKKSELRSLFLSGRRYSRGRIRICVAVEEAGGRKAAFVVRGLKRSAVGRNRYKRLLREVYRLNKHRLKVGIRIAVILEVPRLGAGKKELEYDFLSACEQAGITA